MDHSERSTIGDRIKKIRVDSNLTQDEFKDIMQLKNKQTILNYEKGYNPPTAQFLVNLIQKFKVNINWLLIGEGDIYLLEKIPQDKILRKIIQESPINKNLKLIIDSLGDTIMQNEMANAVILARERYKDYYKNINSTNNPEVSEK